MHSKFSGSYPFLKRVVFLLMTTAWLLCGGPLAHCDKTDDRSFSILKFVGGVVSGFLIHEAGHILTAVATGTEMDWESGNYNQPIAFTEFSDSDSDGFLINSAGLTTQAICSEVILRADAVDKNSDYIRGMMTWNIVNPIFYALDYWLINSANQINGDSYQGDLAGMEYYANADAANLLAVAYVGVALSQGYRFLKTQSWFPKGEGRSDNSLHFSPLPAGGFYLSFQMRF